ncbi:hypothetical protein PanWU01x14_249470 [Parasponia andersonii]|uniref:Uncharacterized protein n=1 Tax=Parasponia andersonii TaxID=3476 RepID=A0A2P5BD90_PARAD|nr:hypothetical protein PanWU01x14_249470 [Parasponia andersonii]
MNTEVISNPKIEEVEKVQVGFNIGRSSVPLWVVDDRVGRCKHHERLQIATSLHDFSDCLSRRRGPMTIGIASLVTWEELGRSSWPESTPLLEFWTKPERCKKRSFEGLR